MCVCGGGGGGVRVRMWMYWVLDVFPVLAGGDHVSLSSAAQCDVATRGKLEDLEQMVEQLTLERNAASAERKEALSAAEEAMGQHYEQQKQITALQYNTDSLKSEIRSLKDRLEKVGATSAIL